MDFDILKAAERVNKQRIDRFLEKVHQALWVIKGKRIAVLGLGVQGQHRRHAIFARARRRTAIGQ